MEARGYNLPGMPRTATAILGLVLAGCATPDVAPSSSFGGGSESLMPPTRVEMPAAVARTEAELRNELATSITPTTVALALVALLDAEERLPEALLVLSVAARRASNDPGLLAARAGVLRDLGRRREAIVELEALRDAHATAFGPGLWFELAELTWLEGDAVAAEAALQSLRDTPAGATFVRERSEDVSWVENAVSTRSRARSVRTRDLLADLRGAQEPAHRLHVLELLLRLDASIAARACSIAVSDPDPTLRRTGVARAKVDRSVLPEFCAMSLSDPDPTVRAAGARRTAALLPAEAAVLLLPTMGVEPDALAFVAMHEVLRELSGHGEPCSVAAALDAAVRADMLASWQEHWAR